MPSAVETCCCGASTNVEGVLLSVVDSSLAKFREAHAACRERRIAPEDAATFDLDWESDPESHTGGTGA